MLDKISAYLSEDFINKIKSGSLMISISGIRAKFPEGITLEMLLRILNAFSINSGNKIIIGNDGRITSPILSSYIESILNFYGKKVLNIGIAPTPTIKASCYFSKADSGIIITASHNPEEWNGIKFLKKGGYFYTLEDYIQLFKNINNIPETNIFKPGSILKYEGIELHIDSVLKQIPNLNEIKKKSYTVVIDPVNSSGIYALPKLLEKLNCKIIPLNCERSNKFNRPPEPTPKSLNSFSKILKKNKASLGFALDPDGDRLVCGSPTLGAINEEYTLGLAYLGKRLNLSKKTKLVINYSTSSLLEKISRNENHHVIRAPVGEVNVLKKIIETNAKFGGEGNGGVIDPQIPSMGRDSLTGVAYILSAMAHHNANTIDDLIKNLPEIYMNKEKIPYSFDKKEKIINFFYDKITNIPGKTIVEINQEDGYFFIFNDLSWIHIRISNTEPIIRIIYEANSKQDLYYLRDYIHTIQKDIQDKYL